MKLSKYKLKTIKKNIKKNIKKKTKKQFINKKLTGGHPKYIYIYICFKKQISKFVLQIIEYKRFPYTNNILIYSYNDTDILSSLVLSKDGSKLAFVKGEKNFYIFDIHNTHTHNTQICEKLNAHERRINSIAFSQDGQTLATASNDKTIKLWNISQSTQSTQSTQNCMIKKKSSFIGRNTDFIIEEDLFVKLVTFSPNGTIMAYYLFLSQKIYLCEISSKKVLKKIESTFIINGLAFSHNGQMIAGISTNAVSIWDVMTGNKIKELIPQITKNINNIQTLLGLSNDDTSLTILKTILKTNLTTMAWNIDDTLLAISNHNYIFILDVQNGIEKQILEGHSDYINSIVWLDKDSLASSSNYNDNGEIIIWRLSFSNPIISRQVFEGNTIQNIAFSSN
jgi:WD40 repeat protein